MITRIDKEYHITLIIDSLNLARYLTFYADNKTTLGNSFKKEYSMCRKLWQRHDRRLNRYAKLFNEEPLLCDWYIAQYSEQ